MMLALAKILDCPGGSISFSESFDLSDYSFGGTRPLIEPVTAAGIIRNEAGVLQLTGSVSTVLHGVCDRCASDFTREVSYPMNAVIVSELANDNGEEDIWTFLLNGTDLDLDEVVSSVVVLNMDSKLLCKDDCKGICCRCGKNLNYETCDCKPEPDPRFAVIRELLENNK